MRSQERACHWETIYQQKGPDEVNWSQEVPELSLTLIRQVNLPADAAIIDIGGGGSKLVDWLLEEGYQNITVLDISATALDKARARLGPEKAEKVTWIQEDVVNFQPEQKYAIWHDRATFHFLTDDVAVQQYKLLTQQAVSQCMIIGTFSDKGPDQCSGLPVKQYDETTMSRLFFPAFEQLQCEREVHFTPSRVPQEFLFCRFRKQ
jgi:SAM-dependent methyltransferase